MTNHSKFRCDLCNEMLQELSQCDVDIRKWSRLLNNDFTHGIAQQIVKQIK